MCDGGTNEPWVIRIKNKMRNSNLEVLTSQCLVWQFKSGVATRIFFLHVFSLTNCRVVVSGVFGILKLYFTILFYVANELIH